MKSWVYATGACPTSWRENSWHRCGGKKLRRCHPMYIAYHIVSYTGRGIATAGDTGDASPVRPIMSPLYIKMTTDSLSSELTFDEWRGVILQRIIRPTLLLHVINHLLFLTTLRSGALICYRRRPISLLVSKAENVATPLYTGTSVIRLCVRTWFTGTLLCNVSISSSTT